MLRDLPSADPIGLETMRRYFELLYDVQELDKKEIVQSAQSNPLQKELYFPFKEVARVLSLYRGREYRGDGGD